MTDSENKGANNSSICILNATHISLLPPHHDFSKPIPSILLSYVPHIFSKHAHLTKNQSWTSSTTTSTTKTKKNIDILNLDLKHSNLFSIQRPQTSGIVFMEEDDETSVRIVDQTLHLSNVEIRNAGSFLVHDVLNRGTDQLLLFPMDTTMTNHDDERNANALQQFLDSCILTDGMEVLTGDSVDIDWKDDKMVITLGTRPSIKDDSIGTTSSRQEEEEEEEEEPMEKQSSTVPTYLHQLETNLISRYRNEAEFHSKKSKLRSLQRQSIQQSRQILQPSRVAVQMTQWRYRVHSERCGRCSLEMEVDIRNLQEEDLRHAFLSCCSVDCKCLKSHSGVVSLLSKGCSVTMSMGCVVETVSLSSEEGMSLSMNAHWFTKDKVRRNLILGKMKLSMEELLLSNPPSFSSSWRSIRFEEHDGIDMYVDHRQGRVLELLSDGGVCRNLVSRMDDWLHIDENGQRLVLYGETPEERAAFLQLVFKYLPESATVKPSIQKQELDNFLEIMLDEIELLEKGVCKVEDIVEMQCAVDEMASHLLERGICWEDDG